MKLLLAASPSFVYKYATLHERLNYYLRGKVAAELHVITTRHWTQEIKNYAAQYGYTVNVYVRDFKMDGHLTTKVLYEEMVAKCDGAVIFWDRETKFEAMLIKLCQSKPLKHYVEVFENLKQELERTKPERKAARKKITVPLSAASKQRYFAAHEAWYKREYATAYKDGFYTKPKLPVINAGSRMDFFITNFIVWSGWSATKVNNMGRKVNGSWVASSTKKGTFDLSCTIAGKSVKIETKHNSDRPSDDQLKMQERERKAGAVAEFVNSVEEFFELYDKIINNEI